MRTVFPSLARLSGLKRPIQRRREFIESRRSGAGRPAFDRPEESRDASAEGRHFRAPSSPARECFNDLGLEDPVQGIGHKPSFPVGGAEELACAKERPTFLQRRFIKAAAIRERKPYMNARSPLAGVGHGAAFPLLAFARHVNDAISSHI